MATYMKREAGVLPWLETDEEEDFTVVRNTE
jgi:hypothetical protein